jgi:flagellar basal-body rod modification protein FlgD
MEIGDFLSTTSTASEGVTQLDTEQEWGSKEFLDLLVAELQNQDPLEPMDNKDLVLQLAQFNTLESTQDLNNNMENFIQSADLGTATSLIGQNVEYIDIDTATQISGKVDEVDKTGDTLKLVVDGVEIELYQLTAIKGIESTTTTSSGS